LNCENESGRVGGKSNTAMTQGNLIKEAGAGWGKKLALQQSRTAQKTSLSNTATTPLAEKLPRLSRKAQQAAPPTTSTAKAP